MFSLGFGEILIICVILIIVVGPERLPTVMKGLGKTMRTVREASREIRTTVGIDELMRDDPPPRPMYRPPPAATIARAQPLPATSEAPDTSKPVEPSPASANAVPAAPPAAAPPTQRLVDPTSAPPAETAVAPSATTAAPEPAREPAPVLASPDDRTAPALRGGAAPDESGKSGA